MSLQNTSCDAFGHNPWAKFDPTPKQADPIMTPEPYAFDFDALTVDLRLLGSWDEGETAFDAIVAMLRGDAALPNGPYQEIRVAEPFANESVGEEERPLDERTYLVTGFEAECPFDYPLELLDEQGTFASIPMKDATYSQIRRLANEVVSERIGRRGCWKAASARIDAHGAHVTIVRA